MILIRQIDIMNNKYWKILVSDLNAGLNLQSFLEQVLPSLRDFFGGKGFHVNICFSHQ